MDSDNLVDLDTLFDTVAFKTQVMVFVGSNELLTRPWCMGEITTAHRHKIPSVKLGLPDFSEPKDDFIDTYAAIVDLSVLTCHGIAIKDAQDAMRWFRSLPEISVPAEIHDARMKDVANAIMDIGGAVDLSQATQKKKSLRATTEGQTSTRIIVDVRNWETCSAGMILERMLAVHYVDRPDIMPSVLTSEDMVPAATKQVILICSSGALESENVMERLLQVSDRKLPVSPVISEDGFSFPTATFVEDHRALASSILNKQQSSTDNVDEQLEAIKSMFAIIGIMFTAKHASDKVLQTKAEEIAARVDYLEKAGISQRLSDRSKLPIENSGRDSSKNSGRDKSEAVGVAEELQGL